MRTRVGRKLDTSRLSSALKRPGIDTRCWVSLALALEDSFVDADHGVFVSVQLVPTEEKYTARVSATYAGNGFGIYRKIKKDDELVLVIPSGEAAEGPVVISQMHSAIDKPSQQSIDDPEEFILVVEQDKNLRIVVSGTGQIFIEGDDNINITSGAVMNQESTDDFNIKSGAQALIEAATQIVAAAPKVLLGSDAAIEALILGTTYRAGEATMNGTLGPSLTVAGASLTAAGTDPVLGVLAPAAAAAIAAAGAALTPAGAAVTTFEAAAATYLSLVSTTD